MSNDPTASGAPASARARPPVRRAAGGRGRAASTVFSFAALAAIAAFGVGYDPFRNALEDRYGLSIFVRITDDNTSVRPQAVPQPPAPLMLLDNSVRRLTAELDTQAFSLAAVRQGALVPRVFVATLPQDMDQIRTVTEKRDTFIRALLPMILAVNERILAERRYLLDLRRRVEAGEALPRADRAWLAALAERYRLGGRPGARNDAKDDAKGDAIDWAALLERVDIVPPSLAIAQSIVETGWGTSAAARRSNALFGMIGGDGTDTARLAAYDSAYASVAAYAHNLNIHGAYAEFRRQRASLRVAAKPVDGLVLAGTLLRYSELGQEYTRYIQGLIDKEALRTFDSAQLAAEPEREPNREVALD